MYQRLLLRLVVPLPIHLALLQLRLLLLWILLSLPQRPASVDVTSPFADPPIPADTSAVNEAEILDGEYVPSTDDDSDPSSMDAVAASGDDEVVLAVCPPSSSGSPRHKHKHRRYTVLSTVPSALVDMDTSVRSGIVGSQYIVIVEEVNFRILEQHEIKREEGPNKTS